MKEISRMIRKHWLSIAAVLILLFIQAMTELSLPAYTSSIINVGIQQGGIESAAIEQIRAPQLQKLCVLMDEGDKEKVLSCYTIDGDIYILNDNVSTLEKEELNSIFGIPMFIVYYSENMTESSDFNFDMGATAGDVASNDIKSIKTQLSQLDDSIISQVAINFVKTEYEALGIDISTMQTSYMLKTGGIMLIYALISMMSSVLITLISARFSATLGRDLRRKLFGKVMTFSNAEFDSFSTASIITRCTNDVQQIQMVAVMVLRMVLYAPIIGIGALLRVLDQGTNMTWVIAVAIGAILCLIIVLFSLAMPKFKIMQKLIDNLNRVSREILTGLPVIRAFSREEYEKNRFEKANRDITKLNLFVNRLMTVMMPTMMLIMNGVSVLIIWVGASQVDMGTMQVGDLTAFITYTMQIIMAFLMISMIAIMLPRAAVSYKRAGEILDKEISVKDPEHPEKFSKEQIGLVEFNNVSFKYHENSDEYALKNISFVSEAGKTTAVIGSTGSGKSTLANLIPRFFDVTEGEILVDGINIKNVSLHDLREKIGYVSQKAVLFSGTIKSNISYSDENLSEERIKTAAKISQSEEFISQKTDGYNDPISQGGGNVSGGQKQRLSIARAVAKKPEIYIFDDSFSALDFKTDATLRKALSETTAESTVIIIAQRISTVLNADQILVLDEGRLVGKGTHSELLKSCETYRQIALSQLSEEELNRKEDA